MKITKNSKHIPLSQGAGGRHGFWRPSVWAMMGWSAISLSGLAADLYLTNTASLAIRRTTWSSPISVPKFNPALGTLLDVELQLSGIVQSTPRVENLDPLPRTVTTGSSASIGVFNSSFNALFASVTPTVTITRDVTAYDGTTDFGGPGGGPGSGFSSPPIAATLSSSTFYPTGHPQLPSFIGVGTVAYGMRATGNSIATGAVNLLFAIDTQAGGTLKVIYHYRPPEASVGDRVWVDLNQDGVQDSGEPGIPGVTVTLYNSSGNPVAGVVPQTTGPNGEYLFTGISVPGGSDLFTVQVSQPAGYNQTFDLDDGVTATPSSANSATFVLAGNEDKRDVDFGYVQPLGSLGDRVWHDVDGDGVQGASEVGLQNATVTLYAAGGSTPLDTKTTDADGKYLFTGLPAGAYTVVVSGVPATFRQTYDLDDGVKTGLTFLSPHQATATIGAGESRLDVDFGYQQIDASVGDYVWIDRNRNGVADSGESPIPGVAVALRDGNGVVLATSTTDGNGFYLFPNLAAGNYSVVVTPPAGYEQTFDLDDGVTPVGGFASASAASFALGVGEAKRDVDFGYVGGQLGDRVWQDVNGDGVQDAGESGLGGVVVTLTTAGGTFTTTSDGNGFYTFGNLDLPAGTYTVSVTPPPGYRQTYDLDDGAKTSGFVSADTATATLGAGVVRLDVDFGYQQLASLGDRVWLDYNGDGVQNAGEVGIEGRAVALFQVVGGVPTQVATQTTDNNGFYHFNDLAPGDYRVTVLNPPARHITTWDFDDQTGSVQSMHTAAVTLVANQHRDDVDFGYQPLGSIGDTVWLDLNKNGVQDGAVEVGISGATVTVTSPTAGTFTATTDANGFYLVDNLPAAVYTVAVTLPSGLLVDQSYDLDDGVGVSGFATPNQASGPLAPGEDRRDFDFGYAPRAAVLNSALGDYVWVDSNANGVQDPGESPIGGVTLTLLQNGNALQTTVTSPTGYYLFSGLEAGTYAVAADISTVPSGYEQTYDLDEGTGPFFTAHTASVMVAENQTRLDVDFGYRPVIGSIGDRVWSDLDANGAQDTGEPGLPGLSVQLIQNGSIIASTTTGADGIYSFPGLLAGTYTVRVATPPADSVRTFDLDGIASANEAVATLGVGENRTDVDFGYHKSIVINPPPINSLGDIVWLDKNGDGLQDGNESGFGGVKVDLLDGSGTQLSTTTTDGAGAYLFPSLANGTYRVRFTAPANYSLTTPDANGNASDAADSDAALVTGLTAPITLTGGQDIRTVDAGLVVNVLDLCVEEALRPGDITSGSPLCGLIRSPGYWKNWNNHYNEAQFSAIIAATPSYGSLSVSAVQAILDNTGDQFRRHLMAAQLNVAANPAFGAGFYNTGVYIGQTVLSIVTQAASTAAPSNDLYNAVLYLGAGGENLTGSACFVSGSAITVVGGHALYLPGIGTDFIFDPTSGRFSEQANGTATLTGFVRSRSNPNQGFAIALEISGFSTAVPASPAGSPKLELAASSYSANGGPINPATWSYYTTWNGTLTGFGALQGAVLNLTRVGPSLQIGYGANGKNHNWGASTWFTWTVASQPAQGNALPASGQGDFNLDFNDCVQNGTAGSIGDRVWIDGNSNGTQDGGELGLANVWVVLRNASGTLLGQKLTDASGNYLFSGLPAGNYTVSVVPPANYGPTYDLDGIATANTAAVVLAAGQNRTDADFGYVFCPPLGSLGDRVWVDGNLNGVQDSGEPGLVGVTVQLLNGATVQATATTGGNGIYGFNNLTAGTYTVKVTPPTGYLQTFDLDGVSSADTAVVTLGSGQNRSDVDFGYRLPASTCTIDTGSLSREVWTCVAGTSVANIPLGSNPNSTSTISALETPQYYGDNYGQRLRGYLVPPTTGTYMFWLAGDDNCQLWLSPDRNAAAKVKIAEVLGWTGFRQWNKYTSQKSAAVTLTAGEPYYIEVLHKEGTGGDHVSVGWSKPGESTACPSGIIPGTALAPITAQLCSDDETVCDGKGLKGYYYCNTTLSGSPVLTRVDEELDFAFGETGTPGAGLPVSGWSARWTGELEAVVTGAHIFKTLSNDGVRVWVNNVLIINNWTDHAPTWNSSPSVNLTAGQRYNIKVEYFDGGGDNVMKLYWNYPGQADEIVPKCQLFPVAQSCQIRVPAHQCKHNTQRYNCGQAQSGCAVGWLDSVGSYCQASVKPPSSGTYQCVVRYSNGGSTPCVRSVYCNGTKVGTITCPPTGSWNNFTECAPIQVNLPSAGCKVRVVRENSSQSGSFDIDYIECRR